MIPLAVYGLTAIFSGVNIGHRHIAPLYPPLFVLLGGATVVCLGSVLREWVLASLLALHVLPSLWACPRYLPYFNVLAGDEGWRVLVDSNIDWGQDMSRLKAKMRERVIDSVNLMYFGTADPRAYGVRYRKCHMHPDLRPREPVERPLPGEYLAISVTHLQLMEGPLADLLRRELKPIDTVGDSMLLYQLPR